MTYSKDISIIVPTYKRPEDLKRALESAAQQNSQHYSLEIIVADNDPLGSAHDAVHSMIKNHAGVDIIYTHVPEPGVSNARNGALSIAQGRFLIFLDDDMEANSDWAFQLASASERLSSAIVFGPVEAVMPIGDNPLYPHMQPLFSRTGAHRSTPAYVWTRNFAFGQGPSQNEADKGFSGALGVIKWMAVGAVQTLIYTPQYLLRRTKGRADYIYSYARLSQAIGKIFWFEGFSPRLYGANAATAHKEA